MARTTTTTTAHHHHHHHHESARDRSCPPRDRSSPSMEPASSRSIDRRGRGPLMRDPPGRDWSRWVPHRKVRYFCAGTFFAFGASAFASVAASIVGRRSSVVVRTHGMVKICMHRVVRVEHPCPRRVRLGVRMHACMDACVDACAWVRVSALADARTHGRTTRRDREFDDRDDTRGKIREC